MKKFYIIWGMIVVILLGIVTYFGFGIINKDKEYKTLENEIENTVSKYLGQYIEEYPEKGSKIIKISDVISKGYNIDLTVNDDKCDGYVVVKKVSIAYEYDGYINCKNYITKGYSK